MRDFGFDDIAALHGGEIILGGPILGVEFANIGNRLRLEGFFQHGIIAIEFDADLIEIGGAAAQGQVVAPIVGIAAQHDTAVYLKTADHIRRCSEGDILRSGRWRNHGLPIGPFAGSGAALRSAPVRGPQR